MPVPWERKCKVNAEVEQSVKSARIDVTMGERADYESEEE
jgi:hypothetical protein